MRNPRNDETEVIPAADAPTDRLSIHARQGGREPDRSVDPDEQDTVVLPAVPDEATDQQQERVSGTKSLGRTAGSVAIAGLFSKVTGFARTLVIVWVLGFSASADAYNVANSMPNQIYELMVGGVLTSVMVPLLVRAIKDDSDGGAQYTQRLVTMTTVLLLAITVVATFCAPLLTDVLVDNSSANAKPMLATAFAYILLPQIVFYGISALFGALLNAREVFGPPAWAPVLNNIILISTFGIYLLPGMLSLDPDALTQRDILVLGIGSTSGVVLQALVVIPSLLRSGFRFKIRWGWDPRFTEFGGLALWTVAYAVLAQLGVLAVTNVTTAHGGFTIYNNVWLLVQLPYGVIGFALITAILPRMSRAAANTRYEDVKDDLSLATRLSTSVMIPMSVLMTVLSPSLSNALFSIGQGSGDTGKLTVALSSAAFGVLPYAVTLIQLRVFYAMKDARTPTLIMVVMTATKAGLTYAAPLVLPSEAVVHGVTFANSASFLIGWIIGDIWLRKRLGRLRMGVHVTLGKTAVASLAAAAAALLVQWTTPATMFGHWAALLIGGFGGIAVALVVLSALKATEVRAVTRKLPVLSKYV